MSTVVLRNAMDTQHKTKVFMKSKEEAGVSCVVAWLPCLVGFYGGGQFLNAFICHQSLVPAAILSV